jgi:periplasmic protein TonB
MGQTAALSPPPPPAVTPSAPPLPVGGKAEVAQLIYGPPPVIPALARQNRIHGVIAIAATVDTQGLLKDVQVVSGNPMLAPAAREAVQRWRYRPAILNGNPVESKVDIKVSFNDR